VVVVVPVPFVVTTTWQCVHLFEPPWAVAVVVVVAVVAFAM
jgi:hypothetical protein